MPEAKKIYPGEAASVAQLLHMADEYRLAAHALLSGEKPARSHFAAPGRMLAVHAIELYLNALLLHAGIKPGEIRGMHHDISARTTMVTAQGLKLRKLTEAHLKSLAGNREYLVLRYDPGWKASTSQVNRLISTLDEVAKKVAQKAQQ